MRFATSCGAVCAVLALEGCVSDFDVGTKGGDPSVYSIVTRVRCELVNLVKKERGPSDPVDWQAYEYAESLRNGNYRVVADLNLNVTESGSVTPNFSYAVSGVFTLGAGFNYGRSRTDQFSQRFAFDLTALYDQWKEDPSIGDCPGRDTNLAGNLGIEQKVTLGLTNSEAVLVEDQLFGGSINFQVEKNVNGAGGTWKLTRFEGPGGFLTLGEEHSDTLTLAFVPLTNPENPQAIAADTDRAITFLNNLLFKQYATSRTRP